ncbi:hypothetical protein ASZ78_014770 [Callipepla squamata]|uniref:RAVE complex protein Rav1 C-terminal domain-containing protein n=1 Tax=Callipepla squamata TaxID=9009 RepID=A0A226MRJ1_CALSU|nr:hypothetical protein ASZ78_014770 [Callipepla squamata]
MNLHQVLTGAVNPGDNCFSVGNLHDQPFTAYASGCDIVVLGTDFERLQIIPGAKHGNIQIAASYGNVVCIFEPVSLLKQNSSHHNQLHYQWQKNAQILLDGIAHNLTWDPTGTRLLTGSTCLQLWSNVPSENSADNGNTDRTDVGEWRCIWQCNTASQVCLMKFSPDGEFFATAGKDDCLVKVWYNTDNWRSAVTPPGASPGKQTQEVDFSFVYLAHPRSVNSFSWRKMSKFMPRGAVCNVLLTCCKDNVCRLWAETLLPSDSLLYGGGRNNWTEAVNFTNSFKRNTSSKERMQNALELNLRHFRRGRRRSGPVVAHTGYSPHQQDPHEVHRNIPPHANALCHFHIAASINPATDIPLLPSITSLSLGENEEKSGPFVVHWLNNKELHFTLSMEVFLQQLKKNFEHHSPETNTEESNQMDVRSEEEIDENGDEQKVNEERKELGDEKTTPTSPVPLSSAVVDHEVEVLLSEWSKNADMLFSIHPMDGSLLVWHVDWLDEYQPGMFRQVQVSFVSRIPVAFPTGDANSLCRSIVMYACTKNVDLAIQQGKQKPPGLTRSSSMLISSGHSAYCNSPSACFVASDGQHLRLYQAVIDAKKLLCEQSNPEISHGRKTQLFHVFQEDFILNNQEKETPDKKNNVVDSDEKIASNIPEAATQTEELYSSPDLEKIQSPFTQKYQACRANLQSTSWLTLSSKMVYSQELSLPEGVEIISVKPSAGHLSSSSIYPVCRAPYLLATSCTDGKVRFWRCRVTSEPSDSSMPEYNVHSDVTYIWEEWPLLIEDGLLSSSAINVPGRPTEVSCAHTNRLAVAYKQVTSRSSHLSQDFGMHVSIFECESTGGSSWILEQTLHLDEIGTMLDSAISTDNNLMSYNRQEVPLSCGNVIPSTKQLVHLDWMSREDGSHILTVGIGSKLYMFGQLSGKMQEQNGKETVVISHIGSTISKATNFSRFVLLRSVDLVSSVEGSPPFPVSLSWVRDGILVVGMDCEMHVYSQWQPPAGQDLVSTDSCSIPSITSLMKESQSAASGLPPPKRTLTRSMTSLAQKLSGKRSAFDLSAEMEDSGLFEAAHMLSPTLPQYHPHQLLELMDLGKVRRTKAILSHLVKCIAGEVVAINESEPNHDRRLRSLTISASGSTSRDPKTFSKTETTDYIEIDSVPPLPLYALLAADDDSSHSCSEKSHSQNSQKDMPKDNYEDLFQTSVISADELVTFDAEEDNAKPKVIDLSQFSPTYFGPEHAQVLSRHLLHSSLPGLTRMEQMSLMALADTIATTSTDIGESRDKSQGGETLDECGLKFLLAVRLHTFLTTSLPPVHRAQLLHQGLSTSHFAWAFHSVAEEELLSMLPAMQKGDPTWSELRAMGIGWWVRNIHSLRKCIEKVAKAAFQRNNDPLDAAIFYLAMKKKAVIWGLYRSQKDTKMTQFFGNNFAEDRWRKAALKNAFSLLGKQRFEHSAAFFLLAGHLKDAVEVCLEKLNDIQLALVISRLYESEFEISSTYKSVIQKRILGNVFSGKESAGNVYSDPFLRSMGYWILEDYSKALDTLIKYSVEDEGDVGDGSASCNPAVFNFYNYLRTHPLLLRRHFGSSDASSTHVCLTAESGLADKINLDERRLFFTTAYAHLKAGCPMLALEVLSKMPKVVKRSKPFCRSSSLMDTSKDFSPSSPIKELEIKDESSSVDWLQTTLNDLGSSSDCSSGKHSSSTLSFDWSQPNIVFQDESLKIQLDGDESDENKDSSLVMKELKPLKKNEKSYETSSSYTESFSVVDEKDILSPSEDIISAQMKFRACLKILTVELRTLSTGCEVDGGKLSSFQANQFTGTVYQTVLLTQHHSLRSTLEETVTPNTSPAQWPGITALVQRLNSAGEEAQPGLTVLLCEILTAVYLSLFIHGLATHSSNDGEKQQKRFKLSSKTSPKESSQAATLPWLDQESPSDNERFIPPELSIWDYFIAKPFLPSQSRVEYDSEESQESGEDDDIDGDAFASNSHNQEHSNANSYRSNSHVALSVKRLWQYLVKQEEVQETFIRNIFTKKRCLNEVGMTFRSLVDHNETLKNSVVEEPIINKIETDFGYPGGKARIIHKESDIITAFAVNKANRNCIAIASSHDIQELDVSAILATQIYTWVDDDVEIENKGTDDFLVIHARDDLVNVQGTTPYTHSNPGTPINMPWLGSTQTGRGASVEYSNKFNGIRKELARKEMLKKAINNVRRMASHPTLPYYLTGAQDGSVRMFEWGHAQQITCFRSGGNSRVTRMRFNYQGNKTWQCHNKTANDFVFISSSSLIATAGLSSDNRNICLWDTLVSPTNSLVHAFVCHDSGATVLAYAPKHQLLISGGRRGFTCIIDLRQKQQQQLLQSHDSQVKAIAVDPTEEYFVTGSAEGNIKVVMFLPGVYHLDTVSVFNTWLFSEKVIQLEDTLAQVCKEYEMLHIKFEQNLEANQQNLRLLQQLRKKDDANFKLMLERIKANQIHKLLREEKDELAEQVLALKVQVLYKVFLSCTLLHETSEMAEECKKYSHKSEQCIYDSVVAVLMRMLNSSQTLGGHAVCWVTVHLASGDVEFILLSVVVLLANSGMAFLYFFVTEL